MAQTGTGFNKNKIVMFERPISQLLDFFSGTFAVYGVITGSGIAIFFGVFYMCFPNKEEYNLTIQVLVGIAALVVVFINFVMQYDSKWTQHKSYKY